MNEKLLPFYILYKLSKADKNPQEMTEEGILKFLDENQDDPITKEAINEFSSQDVTKDEEFANYISGIEGKKSGGKIEYLKKLSTNINTEFFKKGGKMKRKCACGCNLVSFKDKGGKIVEKCACGCKTNKKEKGGEFSKPGQKPTAADTISKYNRENTWADGYGPKSPVTGKVLNTKKEILNAARKEWKGKKIDVKK